MESDGIFRLAHFFLGGVSIFALPTLVVLLLVDTWYSYVLVGMFVVTNFFLGEEQSEFLTAKHDVQSILQLDVHFAPLFQWGVKFLAFTATLLAVE